MTLFLGSCYAKRMVKEPHYLLLWSVALADAHFPSMLSFWEGRSEGLARILILFLKLNLLG